MHKGIEMSTHAKRSASLAGTIAIVATIGVLCWLNTGCEKRGRQVADGRPT